MRPWWTGRCAAVAAAASVLCVACAATPPAPPSSQPAPMNDYPTTDRVIYVQACLRDHPGGYYEMLNKCSCAIDAIARELPFDTFTAMNTATNANTIGGERGGYIRDTETLQADIRKFRQVNAKAKKGCFIGGP